MTDVRVSPSGAPQSLSVLLAATAPQNAAQVNLVAGAGDTDAIQQTLAVAAGDTVVINAAANIFNGGGGGAASFTAKIKVTVPGQSEATIDTREGSVADGGVTPVATGTRVVTIGEAGNLVVKLTASCGVIDCNIPADAAVLTILRNG